MCNMERREWNLKVEIKSNLYPNTFISMDYNQKNHWRCSFLVHSMMLQSLHVCTHYHCRETCHEISISFFRRCYHEIVLHEAIFSVLLAPQCALLNTSNTRVRSKMPLWSLSSACVYTHFLIIIKKLYKVVETYVIEMK